MVRAPCCEKMGLKKGPWTPEEDQILIAYIQNYGHGNWRALPKQAGLLRCGKSCRLRWTNYLRPDIKRGNFSREEEDAIIKLHEMLGNRWSAIAARLPGRTDNEIKNVWHTHLKKRLKQNQSQISETKLSKCESNVTNESESMNCLPQLRNENPNYAPVSPQQSSSDFSSSSIVTVENHDTVIRNNYNNNNNSSDNLLDIDNLLSEALWVEDYNIPGEFSSTMADPQVQSSFPSYGSNVDDGMDFWYDLFMKAGEVPELPIV